MKRVSKGPPLPLILIAGTHGGDMPWWRAHSTFGRAVPSHLAKLVNGKDPYRWTTDLDGVFGKNARWEISARALSWYIQAKLCGPDGHPPPVNIIAHSHGGNVALIAAARYNVRIATLITACTPPRRDLNNDYAEAKINIDKWIHLYSDGSDYWQWLGALGQRIAGYFRTMPYADRNIFISGGHSCGVLNPEVWTEKDLWAFLSPMVLPTKPIRRKRDDRRTVDRDCQVDRARGR